MLRAQFAWCGLRTRVIESERITRVVECEKIKHHEDQHNKGDILRLRLARPRRWNAVAGQFGCVNVPALSALEWHPFTLTSTADNDFVEFYISNEGDWTGRLHALFLRAIDVNEKVQRSDFSSQAPSPWPRVKFQGPYGAPSQAWDSYSYIILVGGGIGMTPMMSIMRHILQKNKLKTMHVRHVWFLWTIQELHSLSWLTSLLKQVQEEDKEGILSVRRFVTRDKRRTVTIGDTITKVARKISGQRTVPAVKQSIAFGRPDLKKFLLEVVAELEGTRHIVGDPKVAPRSNNMIPKVGVFFCGANAFAADLKKAIDYVNQTDLRLSFKLRKETFGV
eukprot:gb/GEZN01008965.1/.p1 GENE.gb/GEZN01008965.1/~~gb/GEZN01008965.1/.p1  ORF type:complete len:375 (-),score=43.73 gb/GEZN01008965.1/:248-1252(-)